MNLQEAIDDSTTIIADARKRAIETHLKVDLDMVILRNQIIIMKELFNQNESIELIKKQISEVKRNLGKS